MSKTPERVVVTRKEATAIVGPFVAGLVTWKLWDRWDQVEQPLGYTLAIGLCVAWAMLAGSFGQLIMSLRAKQDRQKEG